MTKLQKIFLIGGTWAIAGLTIAAPNLIYQKTILPVTSNLYELGTTTQPWLNVFTQNASTTNLTAYNRILVGGTATTSIYGIATSTFPSGLKITGGGLTSSTLTGCDTIDTDSSGNLICGSDSGIGSASFAWTPTTWGGVLANSTTTLIQFFAGSVSATSSIGTLTAGAINATSTITLNGVGLVPYTGANSNVNLGANNLVFNNSPTGIIFDGVSANFTINYFDGYGVSLFGSDPIAMSIGSTNSGWEAKLDVTGLTTDKTFSFPNTTGTLGIGVSTTSSRLAYWGGNSGLYSVATGTISSSGGITVTGSRSAIGGALAISCDVASGSIPGCLAAADWTTFNNKQATVSVNEPITLSGATIGFNSLFAFSTTYGSTTWPIINTGTITATSGVSSFNGLKVENGFTVTPLTSALTLTDANGLFAEYTGTSCTNQFPRSLNALGAAVCATVDISGDTNLTAGIGITLTGDDLSIDTSQNIATLSNLTSNGAILTSGGVGTLGIYGGTSCTNQFIRSLNGSIVAVCATVANTDLTNSSLTYTAGAGLTGGGTVALGASADLAVGAGTCITANANDVAVTSNCTDSATVDSLNGADFLRSNASDEFETGNTLTITGTLDSNGGVSFADTDIVFDGATTNFTSTGNFSINTDDIFIEKTTGNVGLGTTSPSQLLSVHGNSLVSGTSTVGNLIATSTVYSDRIQITNEKTSGGTNLITWNPTIDLSGTLSFVGMDLSPTITVDQAMNFNAIKVGANFTRSVGSLFTTFQLFAVSLTDTLTADVLPWSLITLSDNSIQQYDSVITSGGSQIMVQNVKNLRANISAGTANVPEIVGFKDTPLLGSLTSGGTLLVAERKGIEIKDIGYTATGQVTITENKGIQIDNMALSATNRTVSNIYGINSDLVKGTNRWFIFGAGTASSTLGGALGVGTTSPSLVYSLAVGRIAGGNPAGTVLVIGTTTTGQLYATGTVMMTGLSNTVTTQTAVCIDTNGLITKNSVAATCTVSSARFKHDIFSLPNGYGLNTVLQLNPSSYVYNESTEPQVGFIAEDVQRVDPRLVTLDEKGLPRTVRYEQITAILTKAIQDFYAEFQKLVARVSGLEERINQQDIKIRILEERLNKLTK